MFHILLIKRLLYELYLKLIVRHFLASYKTNMWKKAIKTETFYFITSFERENLLNILKIVNLDFLLRTLINCFFY